MPSLAQRAETIAALYQPPITGRPSVIGSQSTVQQFLEAVGDGNYIDTAAKLAGITKQSVYEWIKRGEAGEEPFATFADSVKEAEARAEAHLVSLQRKAAEAGPQYWAAAATQLERRHPDRWGKRQDENTAPRVVVQVGGNATDVKVLIQTGETFASALSDGVSLSPLEAKAETAPNVLIPETFAKPLRPITALMVTKTEACQGPSEASADRVSDGPVTAHGLPGDPTGVAGAQPKRRRFLAKGRVSRARKKKGHGPA